MRRWSDDLPLIAVSIIFIIDLTLIVTTHHRWESTVDRYFPLQRQMSLLRDELSEAHVWFEEIIGGDSYVDIEKDVMIPFAHEEYKTFVKEVHLLLPEDIYSDDVERIKAIDRGLDSIYTVAQKRWENITEHGIGSDLDQEFDVIYRRVLAQIDAVRKSTEKRLSLEIESRDRYFQWILLLFLGVNAFVFIALYLFKKRRQAAETALAREKEQAVVTMRSIGDAVITTDTDGLVTFLNIVAEELTGYSDAEAVGRPLLSVFNIINDKTGGPAIDPVSRVLKDGKIVGLANHTVLIAKDGSRYQIADSAAPIKDDEGNINGVVLVFRDVTEEYTMQEQLKFEQERLEQAINGTQVGLWDWDLVTNGIYYSPRWKSMIGYEDHELLNTYETWSGLLHPDDLSKAEQDISKTISEPENTYETVFRMRHKRGHWVWVLSRGQVLLDEEGKAVRMIGFHTDISGQKRTEQKLIASNDKYKMLFNESPVPLWEEDFTDLHHYLDDLREEGVDDLRTYFEEHPEAVITCLEKIEVEDVNQAALDLYNAKSKEQLLGELDKTFVDNSMAVFKEEMIAIAEGEKEFSSEAEVKTLDGEALSVFLRLRVTVERNGRLKALLATTDITQQIKDAKALKEQEEMMLAQSRHAAMGEMISMIAHQWRQPLSVISMSVNNLLADIEFDELDATEVQRQSHTVLRQTEQLSHTIDDFRNFFRPNKEKEKVTIASIMDDTQKVIAPVLRSNSVRLEVQNESDTALFVHRRELIQVFLSLFNNAKDAVMAHAKGEKRIVVTIREHPKSIEIDICDNGGGVDKAILAKLFEPYFTTKVKQTGTGLGLYMSKTIVEKHLDGHISVENRGEGACFSVSLPKT